MALGGGAFIAQNKVLPGSYINFVSAAKASVNLSDRGIVALPLSLNWGADGEIIEIDAETFQTKSLTTLGYAFTDTALKGLRDLFKNARLAYLYRINSGTKAGNTFGTARYSGTRGNDLKTVIAANVDDNTAFDVKTFLDTKEVDVQIVKTMAELKDNAFVIWKRDAALAETASLAMTGGTNQASVTGGDYQTALDKLESYSFHVLGCLSKEKVVKDLFVQYTKRLRNEVGKKFQTVVYQLTADEEGIISIENPTLAGEDETSLVYWTAGAEAGCAINRSNTNKIYDGEFTVKTDYRQSELEAALKAGKLMLHKVGDQVRVLSDINTFVSFTPEKNEDFGSNQTIRVLDQIANDIAVLFNTRYLGKVQNNKSGRTAFWSELVSYYRNLEQLQAIGSFPVEDIAVAQGSDKKSVVVTSAVTPVNAMEKLYMTVVVQ